MLPGADKLLGFIRAHTQTNKSLWTPSNYVAVASSKIKEQTVQGAKAAASSARRSCTFRGFQQFGRDDIRLKRWIGSTFSIPASSSASGGCASLSIKFSQTNKQLDNEKSLVKRLSWEKQTRLNLFSPLAFIYSVTKGRQMDGGPPYLVSNVWQDLHIRDILFQHWRATVHKH